MDLMSYFPQTPTHDDLLFPVGLPKMPAQAPVQTASKNEIKFFENPSFGSVRVVMRGEEPWFVARDVCKCLGIANARDAVSRLDEDEKGVGVSDTLGGAQDMCIISESGLYTPVIRSNKPEAKDFRRWVTHDVLPSIRKTGMYMPNFNDPLEAAKAWVAAEEKRRAAELQAQAAQKALAQRTSALSELLNHWGEGETFRSCIAERDNLVKYFNTKYKTDAGDNVYKQCGKLLTQLCTGGLKINDDRFKGHTFEMKRESHPSSVYGGWNVYHVEAWRYFYEIIERDGAASLPYLGKYAN